MRSPINFRQFFQRSLLVAAPPEDRRFRFGEVLAFGAPRGSTRVEHFHHLRKQAGLATEAELRRYFALPGGRWLCRSLQPLEGARWRCQLEPLHAGLLLALCGPGLFHADRPFILTEARLSRELQLHALAVPPSP
jgi:hypothetical protein